MNPRRLALLAAGLLLIGACGGSTSAAQPATFCRSYTAEIDTIGNNGLVGENTRDQAAKALLASAQRLEKAAPTELRANAAKITAYAERNADLRRRLGTEIDTWQTRRVDPPAEWKAFLLAGGPTDDFQAISDYADANCS